VPRWRKLKRDASLQLLLTNSPLPQLALFTSPVMSEMPNELLLQIFGYLHEPITHFSSPPKPGRYQDLASLCRVSRKFQGLATPLLYESIERSGNA
jgi:hypothetical protein